MKWFKGRYFLLLFSLGLLGAGVPVLRSFPPPDAPKPEPVEALSPASIAPPLSLPDRLPPEHSPATPALPSPQSETEISEQVYRLVNPAVVTVYAGTEIGSGSFVRSTGWVITNRHVVRETTQVTVKTSDQTIYQGQVTAIDIRHDLALIHLTTATQFPTVRLVDALTVRPGDRVFAIGSPFGKAGILTTGTFSRTTDRGSLQTSAGLLKPGNSGGPLLNDRGEMIGVNKGLLEDDSGLATSAVAVREFLRQNGAETLGQP